MKYLRSKPLIDDITHQKPPVLFSRTKPRTAYKLAPHNRIPNQYEAKFDNNLYVDILSQPMRSDRLTKTSLPRPFLLKLVFSIVQSDGIANKSPINITTTLKDAVKVVIRPEWDQGFKKFEAEYLRLSRKRLIQLGKPQSMLRALIPLAILNLKKDQFRTKNFELDLDVEKIDTELQGQLFTALQEIEPSAIAGDDVKLDFNGDNVVSEGVTLDLSIVNAETKDLLLEKFGEKGAKLAYNDQSKALIQIIYRIINYYR